MITVRILIDAGARLDPSGLGGLAYLTADLLTEGTTRRSATDIDEEVDFLGASLSSGAQMDYAEVSLRVLKKDLDAGIALLTDVLLNPAFAENEFVRRREAILAAILAAEDDPTQVAAKRFQQAVFEGEPYGHPTRGLRESVERIRRADVRSFYERTYRPAGAIVVVVGDISAAEARSVVSQALAGWTRKGSVQFSYPETEPTTARSIRVQKPVTQAAIILGHRGIPRDHRDYETILVMNYILGGGGFSSRLMESIRTQAGLAYSVGSSFDADEKTGSFQVVMQTKKATIDEAIGRARAEIERIRTEPVRDDELQEAKQYLTGSFPLRIDSHGEIAQFIAGIVFYDLGLDYAEKYMRRIQAVTKEDVQRVAREYLHPDRFIELVVSDLD